ncbi:MAG: hypothetical protein M1834_005293 [Cirrosporium novae-zelandiae]|nr:MAG: hypothetical protein M1834_005293 [Cirrosporium novae-zelandiae]
MNVSEDRDIKLQKASGDLIKDFHDELPNLLWKKHTKLSQAPQPRLSAKTKTVEHLRQLLEPFQEWPQLLDPHLNSTVPLLVDAFLAYLGLYKDKYHSLTRGNGSSSGFMPLPRAISSLIYTLCKIRGVKIISRFFNNEPRYLEPMMDAFLQWDAHQPPMVDSIEISSENLIWEERYVMLNWLSLLLLTPFDLASISSISNPSPDAFETLTVNKSIPNLPSDLPSVVYRALDISVQYIFAPSKDREAAQSVLVRLSLRPDMQQYRLFQCLLQWMLSLLQTTTIDSASQSAYVYTGSLSFISGISSSAERKILKPFIPHIFQVLGQINDGEGTLPLSIRSSALNRKLIIKTSRALTLLQLKPDARAGGALGPSVIPPELEDVIDHLLTSLADKDTPVRFASSKALSVITTNLDLEFAAQIAKAVITTMAEDLLWEDLATGIIFSNAEVTSSQKAKMRQNLTAVNPLRWQGLALTLAQLLFRRSPSPEQLPQIISALVPALGFEQRSATGISVGTSVRDAACFGVWALSRKYTTKELLAVPIRALVELNGGYEGKDSILQALAVELVVTGCLDPAGNIRRGSSAALQELIGRHPDEIACGIFLVQTVDYHAVSLRSKAMIDVTLGAASLEKTYWRALVDGHLGWRGCGSPNADPRRWAASALGELAVLDMPTSLSYVLHKIKDLLSIVSHNDVEFRHGLLISLSRVIQSVQGTLEKGRKTTPSPPTLNTDSEIFNMWELFNGNVIVSRDDLDAHTLRPDLSAEAACSLIASMTEASTATESRPALLSSPPRSSIAKAIDILSVCLSRTEEVVVKSVTSAVSSLFATTTKSQRKELCHSWVSQVISNLGTYSVGVHHFAYILALGAIFRYLPSENSKDLSPEQSLIVDTLIEASRPGVDIESRVASIQSLTEGVLSFGIVSPNIVNIIGSSLNDYTSDQRGDIGSLVRLEAIKAVRVAWEQNLLEENDYKERTISPVVRLAAEKLDKVRFRAWVCLEVVWNSLQSSMTFPPQSNTFPHLNQTSSVPYFTHILSLLHVPTLITPFLEGYVTTVGAGAESTLKASRFALIQYLVNSLETGDTNRILLTFWNAMLEVLKRNLSNDRILAPTLETIAFLCYNDMLTPLVGTNFKFRTLLSLIQKSHYKSTNIQKLETAPKIYIHLLEIPSIKDEAMKKLVSMLLHPFPGVRNAAADALSMVCEEEQLKKTNWSMQPKILKETVDGLRKGLLGV